MYSAYAYTGDSRKWCFWKVVFGEIGVTQVDGSGDRHRDLRIRQLVKHVYSPSQQLCCWEGLYTGNTGEYRGIQLCCRESEHR